MNSEQIDRRIYKRIYFSKNDAIYVHVRNLNEKETIFAARLKDLGEGGIGFMLHRNDAITVKPEDRLVIDSVQGSTFMDFLIQLTLVVKWVINADILDHIGFGCTFEMLEASVQEKIQRYISEWS